MWRIFALSIVFTCLATGQTNRGGISGTVTDQSGGIVPGVRVTITNLGTNEARAVTTSASGAYSVQNLDPVTYRVECNVAGFKKGVLNNVKVDTASVATANFRLETGNVQSEVTVNSTSPLINTESGTASQTIGQELIDNSPLVNRSVLDLALSVPGVVGDVGSEEPGIGAGATVPGYNLSINGGRAGSSQIMADGVNNTGVGVARAIVSFSPETVQEFTVQTNAYSAEYGRTGGGLINVTTKSGTNDYHGTALWYQRNPTLNAAPYTTAATNRPVSNTRDNQFSLAVGGPVIFPKIYNGHNKTFFFGAIEPRYRTDHLQVDGAMPDDAMRNGDFSNTVRVQNGDSVPVPISVANQFPKVIQTDATLYQHFTLVGNQLQPLPPAAVTPYAPFPNNVIPPAMLDPLSQKLLQWVPKPNTPWFIDTAGNLANWIGQRHLKTNNVRYTMRLDQVISERNQLNFRVTIVPVVGLTDFNNAVNGNGGNYSNSRQLTLNDTHIISSTLFNDLRVNYTRGRFSGTFGTQFDAKTGENLSTENGLPSLTHGGVPSMAIGLGSGGGIGAGGSTLGDNVEERYSVSDTVTFTHGSMNIKTGVELTHELLNTVNYYAAAGGIYNFRPYETGTNGASSGTGGIQFASFLLGVPNAVNISNALLPYYYRWNSGAAFIQDDWKIKPNLTLNLGLRYALQLPRTEKYNHQGTFLPSLAQSVSLPAPIQLANGATVSSALVPPFALDGYGGRSRYLWPADYTDFEPRFGFAYTPRLLGLNNHSKFVIRGGYGLSHSSLNGQNRQPLPSFTAGLNGAAPANPNFAQRLSSNPPVVTPLSWSQILTVPDDGLITLNSLNYTGQGFAVSSGMRTPYSQNWNLTLAYQFDNKDALEVAYVANKGTHLQLPKTNNNAASASLVNALHAANLSPTTLVPDPLGRRGPNGNVINVQQGSLGSTFLGFTNLYTWWNSAGNSIYNAAYISYRRRASRGLTVSSSYTFGKSIDDASDASPETNVLSTSTSIAGGSANFGGSRILDRAVSTFDVKHNFVLTSLYDLPVGRGRMLFSTMSRPLELVFGGWTTSGIYHLRSAPPFAPVLRDNNLLGDNSSGSEFSIRPNIVPGVPLVNPLYTRSCPTTVLCQPYLNPAGFERPAFGQIGDSPRTIDGSRAPMLQYFDASIQKSFQATERIKVQIRVDLLNAFNHPVFGPPQGYGGGNSWNANGAPSTAPISAAAYNNWAKYNNQPLSTTPEGATNFAAVQSFITASRNPQGALPANFFAVPLQSGTALANPNSFNILTLDGYKQYTLANANGSGFGDLNIKTSGSPSRYVQFGIKIYF